jgi:O-antigen/teichoic acid export membrane protein
MPFERQESKVQDIPEQMGARTATVASSIFVAKVVSFLLNGAAFVLVARLLGPSTYGLYILAMAVAGFFGFFGDFGIGTAFSKFLAEQSQRKERGKMGALLSNGFAILFVGSGIFTIAAIALSGPAAQYVFHSESYAPLVIVAALTIVLSATFSVCYSALIGLGRGKSVVAAMSTQSILQATFAIGLVLLGFGAFSPIIGLVIGYAAGAAFALYILFVRTRIGFTRPTIKGMKGILSFSVPIAVSNISGAIASNVSLIVLGLLTTSIVVGNFGITSRISSIIDIVNGSISLSLLPFFATALSRKATSIKISRFYNYSIYFAFILVAPVILLLVVLAKPITYTIFGGTYALAPPYIVVLGIGTLLGIAGGYSSTLLISANRVKDVMKYNIVVAIVQIALLVPLIDWLGGLGLALITFLISPIIVDLFMIRKAQHVLKVKLDIGRLARVVVADLISIAFVIPLILFFNGNFIALLPTAVVEQILLYPAVLSLIKGVTRSDLDTLNRVSAKIPIGNVLVSMITAYTRAFIR